MKPQQQQKLFDQLLLNIIDGTFRPNFDNDYFEKALGVMARQPEFPIVETCIQLIEIDGIQEAQFWFDQEISEKYEQLNEDADIISKFYLYFLENYNHKLNRDDNWLKACKRFPELYFQNPDRLPKR